MDHWTPKTESQNLISLLPDLLPVLRFVFSAECRNIVRSIKSLSWNANSSYKKRRCRFRPYKSTEPVRALDPADFYSQMFWRAKEPVLGLLDYTELTIESISWKALLSNNAAKCDRSEIEALTLLVHDKIIKPGRLAGVPSDFIISAIDVAYAMLFKVYKFYKMYIGE